MKWQKHEFDAWSGSHYSLANSVPEWEVGAQTGRAHKWMPGAAVFSSTAMEAVLRKPRSPTNSSNLFMESLDKSRFERAEL